MYPSNPTSIYILGGNEHSLQVSLPPWRVVHASPQARYKLKQICCAPFDQDISLFGLSQMLHVSAVSEEAKQCSHLYFLCKKLCLGVSPKYHRTPLLASVTGCAGCSA